MARGDETGQTEAIESIAEAWRQHGADATVFEWSERLDLQTNVVDDVADAGKSDGVAPIPVDLLTTGCSRTQGAD